MIKSQKLPDIFLKDFNAVTVKTKQINWTVNIWCDSYNILEVIRDPLV